MEIWRVGNLELPGLDKLDEYNRRLRAGKMSLDWSAVKAVPPRKQLSRLLAGLNLSDDSDSIGIGTVPGFLLGPLRTLLSDGQEPRPLREAKQFDVHKYQQKPGIWFPDGQDFDADATVQKRISAFQDIAELVSQQDTKPPLPDCPDLNSADGRSTREGDLPGSSQPGGGDYEQRIREARSRVVLDMKELSTPDATKLYDKLQPMILAYKLWIEEQEGRLRSSSGSGRNGQQDRFQALYTTLARLEEGINLLKRRTEAAQAFAFVNRAMWLQHIHYLYTQEKQRDSNAALSHVDQPENYRWELFQLAFLLLTIPDLTNLPPLNRGKEGKAIADLLRSLPGADKTDVYLGLIAYDLAIRRLQGYIGGRSGENGIAVILRYVQLSQEQLQRIYTLICACETIRRGDTKQWRETPFRLGLWTGAQSELDDGMDITLKKQDLRRVAEKSPSINRCPWCGEAIVGMNGVGKGEVRYCSDPSERCLFSKKKVQDGGLPALLLNEEIYRATPSVLVATTDTFLNSPWKEETRIAFGQVEKRIESRNANRSSSQPARGVFLRPPDLVLQDDLEQISGRAGSQAGQAVIDHHSSWKIDEIKVRPKVVAALPGFRQSNQEIRAIVYMREINVFPPQSLNAEENFFFS